MTEPRLQETGSLPEVGSLWERDDEVYRVEDVYQAKQHDGRGGFADITLVKVILVEPMPWHPSLPVFLENYKPYDADAS